MQKIAYCEISEWVIDSSFPAEEISSRLFSLNVSPKCDSFVISMPSRTSDRDLRTTGYSRSRVAIEFETRRSGVQGGTFPSDYFTNVVLDIVRLSLRDEEELRLENAAVENTPFFYSSVPLYNTRAFLKAAISNSIAVLAYRAAAAGVSELSISTSKDRFTNAVADIFLRAIPIGSYYARPFLDALHSELRKVASKSRFYAEWGYLKWRPNGLYLEVTAKVERKPKEREKATIVRGLAFG